MLTIDAAIRFSSEQGMRRQMKGGPREVDCDPTSDVIPGSDMLRDAAQPLTEDRIRPGRPLWEIVLTAVDLSAESVFISANVTRSQTDKLTKQLIE